MNSYRMGNAYNVKAEKMFHCIEVMIKGKWMPVILEQGLAVYDSYSTCYSVYTKLLVEEQQKSKSKTPLTEKTNVPTQEMNNIKEENERLRKTIIMLNRKLKTPQTTPEKDTSELGTEENDN